MDNQTKETLEKLSFSQVGEICRDSEENRLSFILVEDYVKRGPRAKDCGWVYLWVKANSGDRFHVCYVGKAGFTLSGRCDQHKGGFNGGSKKGMKHAERIHAYLSEEAANRILVYARKSSTQRILDEDDVSMCEAEERAVIAKLRRSDHELWNG